MLSERITSNDSISNNNPKSVTFKASYWFNEQSKTETIIHISGKTAENKSVYVLVKNYKPSVYLELPPLPANKKWDKILCGYVFNFIQTRLEKFGQEFLPAKTPLLIKKEKLYYKISYRRSDKKAFKHI